MLPKVKPRFHFIEKNPGNSGHYSKRKLKKFLQKLIREGHKLHPSFGNKK
jgi:hypothetical protein